VLRRALLGLSAVGLAGGLVVVGGVVGSPGGAQTAAPTSTTAAPGSIEALQARLAQVPGDAAGWAALGGLYVDRARVTADPSWYAKAQQALDRSFEVQPEDNAAALTGLATLQAAQHLFAEAEATARRSLEVNAFDDTAWGALTDALVELGRYDEAVDSLQRMADVDPGFPALSRISYARELRGDRPGAVAAMEQALKAATREEDAGFALFHLGQLAWDGGDRAEAERRWTEGLRRDPESLPLQAGLARAAAAAGRVDEALSAYEQVTARVPVQQYLVEHAELLQSLGRDDEAERPALCSAQPSASAVKTPGRAS
jgi:tetratricopeptide (TPR) repeat protein